jgi:predicted metal-dependent peptidase
MLDPAIAESISAALMRICARNSFFGALVLHARLRASHEIPTAATDGRDIFVNNGFFASLTPPEREAVLLHEVLHAALRHVPRRGGRDPTLWNIAADIVVNGMLAREGYQLPKGGLRDPQHEHLGVEEVYELLQRAGQQHSQEQLSGDLLTEAPGDASATSTASGAETGDQPGSTGSEQGMPSSASGEWEQALERARMVAQAQGQGNIPAGLQRELGILAAGRLDWRTLLWRYMARSPIDFLGFDRRFIGQQLYLDALESETIRIALAVDTSGSIDGSDMHTFLGEVHSILRAYPHVRCSLYYADAEVHGPYRLSPRGTLPPPVGGGGTDFRPFFERVGRRATRERADLAIYLTDGWGAFPETPPICPVMWVVTPGGRDADVFPFGQVVRMIDTGHPRGQPAAGWGRPRQIIPT